ncbi:MAG: glycosyltransferase family 2 protein, partial [Bacteroidota bacterium]|nr:glycosyltransferase family 2 protein [Bacteroidota bacterium]
MTFAPTCFLLIRRDVFEKVGLMDERYFVYWDDTDFVYRAVMKQHHTLWYIPASVVHHKEGTSTGVLSDFSIRFQYRNLVYFALKNYSRPYAEYVIVYNMMLHIVHNLFRWPMAKWKLGMKSFMEGFNYYRHASL